VSVARAERIKAELGWQPRYTDIHTILASAWMWRQRHPHGYDGGQ
jgi:UDP-glucose 4-epimerase